MLVTQLGIINSGAFCGHLLVGDLDEQRRGSAYGKLPTKVLSM